MEVTFFRYDNARQPLGIMRYVTATHEEALDGTDILTVVTDLFPNKRDRLVWQDSANVWHEHIVDSTVTQHVNGRVLTTCTCSNSISELYLIGIDSQYGTSEPLGTEGVYYGGPNGLLEMVLSSSTWYEGDCDEFPQIRIEVWGKSVRQCIAEMCDLTGGELETEILVNDKGVFKRTATIVAKRGDQTAKRQFSYGRNIKSVKREVAADEVYTSVRGLGAITNADSPYAARIMTTYSNGQYDRWGTMLRVVDPAGSDAGGEEEMGSEDSGGGSSGGEGEMGDGGSYASYHEEMGASTTLYIDESVDNVNFLQTEAKRMQATVAYPLVRYEFDALDIEDADWKSVGIGDAISICDEPMGLHMVERVSSVKRTFVHNDQGTQIVELKVCIGERPNFIADKFIAAEKVGQMTNGNSSRSNAKNATYTGGTHGHGSGGDGTSHTLDGSPITGTIAFTSAQGS